MLVCCTFVAFKTRIDAFLLDSSYTITKEKDGRISIKDIDSPRWKQIAANIFSSSAREKIKSELARKEFTSQDDSNKRSVRQYALEDRLVIDISVMHGEYIMLSCGGPPSYVWKNGELKGYWESITLGSP